MTDAPTPPAVDPGEGWSVARSTIETVFRLASVSVTVATRVFDDTALRAAVRAEGGPDVTLRFVFGSRCRVPGTGSSGALARLVADRAKRGFVDRLRDRGFEAVRETGRRSLRTDDATAFAYEARCPLAGVTVGVEGWLAVRDAGDGDFLLVGGAYPTTVLDATDDETAAAVRAHLDPTTFRRELFDLLETVE